MVINLKDRSRVFKIDIAKLKERPKPKSLLLLGMITRSNAVDDIFLSLVRMRFANTIYYRRRSLINKANRNSYMRLKNKANSNQRSMKHVAIRE